MNKNNKQEKQLVFANPLNLNHQSIKSIAYEKLIDYKDFLLTESKRITRRKNEYKSSINLLEQRLIQEKQLLASYEKAFTIWNNDFIFISREWDNISSLKLSQIRQREERKSVENKKKKLDAEESALLQRLAEIKKEKENAK